MRLAVSQRDLRILVIGVTCCATIAGISRGVPLWRQWRDEAGSRASETTTMLARVRASIVTRASVEQRLSRLTAEANGLDSLVLHEPSSLAGAAELASIVRSVSDEDSVAVDVIQLRPDTTAASGLVKVAVRLSANADIGAVASLLADLESGAPLLVVRELSVFQAGSAAPDGRPVRLRIDVLVEALAAIPARAVALR